MSLTSSAGSSVRRKSRIIVSDRSANTSSGPDRRITGAGRISFQVSTGITRPPPAPQTPVPPGPDLARVPATSPPIAGASLCGTTDRTRLSGHRRCTLTPQPQPGGCRGQKRQAHGIGAYHSSFGARKQIEQSRRRVPVRVVCTHTNESHGSPKLEVEFGALVARSVMRNLDDVHRPNPAEGTHSLLGGSAQITEKNCSVRDILHVDDNAGVIAGRDIRNPPHHPPPTWSRSKWVSTSRDTRSIPSSARHRSSSDGSGPVSMSAIEVPDRTNTASPSPTSHSAIAHSPGLVAAVMLGAPTVIPSGTAVPTVIAAPTTSRSRRHPALPHTNQHPPPETPPTAPTTHHPTGPPTAMHPGHSVTTAVGHRAWMSPRERAPQSSWRAARPPAETRTRPRATPGGRGIP